MRKLYKLVLALLLLVIIGLTVCTLSLFYPIPYVTETVWQYYVYEALTGYVIAGLLAFFCLFFFILMFVILFFPGKTNFLVITKERGSLLFSKKTVESAVKYSYANIDGVISSNIRVKLRRKPEKTKVFVRLSLAKAMELAPVTETVQESIISCLQASLGISIKSVTVKITELIPDKAAAAASDAVDSGTVVTAPAEYGTPEKEESAS